MTQKGLNKMAKCPLCNGEGRKIIVEINPYTKLKMTSEEWCLCKKASYVSERNQMLQWLGDQYLPLESIDPNLVFLPKDLRSSPNLLIQNTYFQTLCIHVKSIIMKYRSPSTSILFCKGFSILKDYYVEQSDGSNPSLLDLNKFDLLIMTLDTLQKNEKLHACISEVVHNRLSNLKPTWIWLPKGTPLDNTIETSDELKAMLKPDSTEKNDNYKKIEIKGKTLKSGAGPSKVSRKAEGFKI